MKNKVLIICAGLILLIFLTFGTYAWYLYFLRAGGIDTASDNSSIYLQSGDLLFKDEGVGVYDADAKNTSDTDISNVPSYNFQVINNKKETTNYILYIEDLPINSIDDGCTEETLLSREQLKYQLSLNGKIIKEGYMGTINDNILDEREIDKNVTNNYSLKIYIYDDAQNWFGKHYHYKVVLKK